MVRKSWIPNPASQQFYNLASNTWFSSQSCFNTWSTTGVAALGRQGQVLCSVSPNGVLICGVAFIYNFDLLILLIWSVPVSDRETSGQVDLLVCRWGQTAYNTSALPLFRYLFFTFCYFIRLHYISEGLVVLCTPQYCIWTAACSVISVTV